MIGINIKVIGSSNILRLFNEDSSFSPLINRDKSTLLFAKILPSSLT